MSLSLAFSAKENDMGTDKLAISWQNFTGVRLQLKFAYTIRPQSALRAYHRKLGNIKT